MASFRAGPTVRTTRSSTSCGDGFEGTAAASTQRQAGAPRKEQRRARQETSPGPAHRPRWTSGEVVTRCGDLCRPRTRVRRSQLGIELVRRHSRCQLDVLDDAVHRCPGVVGRRLHGERRRRRADRHRRVAGEGPRRSGQGDLRPRPLPRIPGAQPDEPRHIRARDLHGRADRWARLGRWRLPTSLRRRPPIAGWRPMLGSSQ